jgi:SAM-dependent methyltransferase
MPAAPRSSTAALDERGLLHLGGSAGTWGSLGLWPHADTQADYASACSALALAVGQAAGLVPGCRVLSVACGAGDELRLWQQHFQAGAVCGVERDAALVQTAATDLDRGGAHIRVLHGSGTALLALGLLPASFDAVVCVDAAYHLRPRRAFLQGAFALLRPGGRLAYTDLLLDDAPARGAATHRPAWRTALLRASARACGLRADDLQSPHDQLQRLRAQGYIDARLQRLDAEVLDGFARHVQQQAQRHRLSAWQPAWRRPALTARLIAPCRAAGLGYALIAATRP